MKLGHIGLPVGDIKKAETFYDAIASTIGLQKINSHDDFVGYGSNGSYAFYLHTERDAVTGLHVCFEVGAKEDVNAFYDAGLAHGGKDNGGPGIREQYSPDYYAAFVIDPDGNNIEALYRAED